MYTLETTCRVKFILNLPGDYRYKIKKIIDPNIGGRSTLGYVQHPYYEFVQNHYGVILHELCHCLGLSHEHQRYERNGYITINWENIMEGYENNFEIIPLKIHILGNDIIISEVFDNYDYGSIMHYSAYAFSNNGEKTIESYGNPIGQRTGLSETDELSLQTVYGGYSTCYDFENQCYNCPCVPNSCLDCITP